MSQLWNPSSAASHSLAVYSSDSSFPPVAQLVQGMPHDLRPCWLARRKRVRAE